MADDDLQLRIEAVLMTADRPLGERKLAGILQLIGGAATDVEDDEPEDGESVSEAPEDAGTPIGRLRAGVEALNEAYARTGRSFRIERVAGGLQILTLPEFTEDITRLKGARQSSRLSQAALETLAIIAYRQPILRADLESIRGVACGEVLRSLMERRLVRIAGRAEELGRPMLYGTTKEFLEVFGLATLDDLPNAKDLRPVPTPKPAAKPTAEADSNPAPDEETSAEAGSSEAESSEAGSSEAGSSEDGAEAETRDATETPVTATDATDAD